MIPVLFFIFAIAALVFAAIWFVAVAFVAMGELLEEANLEVLETREGLHYYRSLAADYWRRSCKFERLAALRGNRLDEAQRIAAKIELLAADALAAHLDPEGDVKATIQAGKDATR